MGAVPTVSEGKGEGEKVTHCLPLTFILSPRGEEKKAVMEAAHYLCERR